MIRLPLLVTLLLLALAAPAAAMVESPGNPLPVRKVNPTVAHRDHVHIAMTRRGAAARTSFWSRGR